MHLNAGKARRAGRSGRPQETFSSLIGALDRIGRVPVYRKARAAFGAIGMSQIFY